MESFTETESSGKGIKEVERAVLSCIFFYYKDVSDLVDIYDTPIDWFESHQARRIFQALKESTRINDKYDITEVHATLRNICSGRKDLASCEEYLSSLTEDIQYYSIKDYLQILRANRIKRDVNRLAEHMLEDSYNFEFIDDQIDRWRKRLDHIASTGMNVNSSSIDQAWQEWDKLVSEAKELGKNSFLRTRYSDIDNKIKSLGPGQFVVIASRPGVGKTTFSLNIIRNNFGYINKAHHNNAAAIGMFSLEMTTPSLLNKFLAMDSSCPLETVQRLMDGETIEEWEKKLIYRARDNMSNLNILFCDDSNISFGKIAATIKTWVREHNLKLVIIDYLQLINYQSSENGIESVQQYQKIGMISRNLKILAMELNICILSLAQLNRKVEERRGSEKSPILSDLRESGSIEQDADVVMFLYESPVDDNYGGDDQIDDDKSKRKMSTMLKIAKNRHGPVGTIEFNFDKTRGIYKVVGEK